MQIRNDAVKRSAPAGRCGAVPRSFSSPHNCGLVSLNTDTLRRKRKLRRKSEMSGACFKLLNKSDKAASMEHRIHQTTHFHPE